MRCAQALSSQLSAFSFGSIEISGMKSRRFRKENMSTVIQVSVLDWNHQDLRSGRPIERESDRDRIAGGDVRHDDIKLVESQVAVDQAGE